MPKYHIQIFGNIAGRIGIQSCLISKTPWIRFPPPQLKLITMDMTMSKDGKIMTCIIGYTVRDIINQANELEIPREDIVSILPLAGQIYLFYYK